VFEIGNSLREARLRQGRDLVRVESDTKIRAKYLQALEEERFDLLPAETYVKGFLRTYADYLGLDSQLYVDEYNSRFASIEELPIASRAPRGKRRRAESSFVVIALVGIVAVTGLVIAAWQLGTGSPPADTLSGGGETMGESVSALPSAGQTQEAAAPEAAAKPVAVTVVLNAIGGDTWLAVRAGSAGGELLFQGTLEKGQTQRFVRRKVWLQYGAGDHLELKLDGKRVKDIPTEAAVVVVTSRGVRVVSTG
jgi:cytoskeletal protein RodZ